MSLTVAASPPSRFNILEVRGLCVSFGNLQAVCGLSLSVPRGEVAALLGPNAAGKSSALAAISGLVRPTSGDVLLDGFPITGLPPRDVVRRGLVHVPQGRVVFAGMTVEENLLVGAHWRGKDRAIAGDLAEVYRRCPELRERRRIRASALTIGEQQLLTIARGLMARPRLLLLDEPTLGLPAPAIRRVYDLIGELRQSGLTILLVDQRLRKVLSVAQHVYVVEHGALALSGTAQDLAEDVRLLAVAMGSRIGALKSDDAWVWTVQRNAAAAASAAER